MKLIIGLMSRLRGPVVLLNNVVQILNLPDLDALEGSQIGPAFIHGDRLRRHPGQWLSQSSDAPQPCVDALATENQPAGRPCPLRDRGISSRH
ncbi:UNVERIFIED_ORG: hypothetical protein ABIC72_005677 [Burkholderia sp. 1988]|nr:hypothetical protein [Paraburkholderia terricola]